MMVAYGGVSVNYPNVSVESIKKEYHLDALCPANTSQKENIALTIKSLYLYEALMKELDRTNDEELKVMNRKTIITLSYSVIDGIVACLGFKMQNRCYNCKRRCSNYSNSMFASTPYKNEMDAFKNADAFLKKIKIIYLDDSANKFYKQYRDVRNNIHLTRNSPAIIADSSYSKKHVEYAFKFVNDFIEMLYNNYNNFLNVNHCIQRGGK